jgi:YggT family protein
MNGLIHGINNIFNLFYFLIILRIFLSWIPSVDWQKQPFETVKSITDLYLDLFRRIIPPFGGLDFSPIVAIIALQIIQNIVLVLITKAFV